MDTKNSTPTRQTRTIASTANIIILLRFLAAARFPFLRLPELFLLLVPEADALLPELLLPEALLEELLLPEPFLEELLLSELLLPELLLPELLLLLVSCVITLFPLFFDSAQINRHSY